MSERRMIDGNHRLLRTAVCAVLTLASLPPARAERERADTNAIQLAQAQRTARPATMDNVVIEGSRERDTVALDSVAVTGSRLGIEIRDLPASVSVVTQEFIQALGARTAIEAINGAVGMTGGMSVGSIPSFSTRGFTSNDITIMRDGIRQNTGSQSSRPMDTFLVDRVEVLKGPASLLYGEGAVGGAINYVSKLPTDMFTGEAYASAGSWEAIRFGAGAGGPTGIDDLYFRLDASRATSEGYVDRAGFEYNSFAGALRFDVSDDTSLTFSGAFLKDATKSYYGTPVVYDGRTDQDGNYSVAKANAATDRLVNARIEPGTERLNYNNVDNFARAENSFWRLILESQLGGNWSVRNEAYFATQRFSWRNTESTVWNPATQLVDRSSFFLIYRNDNQIGNRLDLLWNGKIAGRENKFLIGAIYDHNDQVRNSGQTYPGTLMPMQNVPLFGFDPGYGPDAIPHRTYYVVTDTVAAYAENMFSPIAPLKLVAGLRYEQIDLERISYVGSSPFSKSYKPLTGRLGAVYDLTPKLNVYASYSTAAQPVAQLVGLSADQANNFSLQKGHQYEVGMKATLFNDRLSATIAVFDIEKNDLLTNAIDANGDRVLSQIGAQVSQGLEVALSFSLPQDWRIDANYARTWKAEFEEFNENVTVGGLSVMIRRGGNTPPNVAKTVASVLAAKDIGPMTFTTNVRHVGERQANNNNGIQMDAYTTVDASVGYRIGDFTVTLRGRNLSDEQYAEWAVASGLVQRLGEPRSAELDVRVKF